MWVFPMYVGVILKNKRHHAMIQRVPHVCGGDPMLEIRPKTNVMCSPCMWGVIPILLNKIGVGLSVPHVNGGDYLEKLKK